VSGQTPVEVRQENKTLMDGNLYRVVEAVGHLFVKDGAASDDEVAAGRGLVLFANPRHRTSAWTH
jgi:hypothetical protein